MKKVLPLFIMVIGLLPAYAQETVRYKFDHFTPAAGLSSTYTRKIIQDPYGFIWIGTIDGLNRYNGKTFSIYNKDIPGGHVLTGSDIRDLLLDTASNSIWSVNSYGGIDQVNYITGNVTYSYHQNLDAATKDLLFSSLALHGRKLYIGSSNGMFVFNIEKKKIEKINLKAPLPKLYVNDLQAGDNGKIWAFCENFGVVMVNAKNDQLAGYYLSSKPVIRYYDVCGLQGGAILAGTSAGLFTYTVDRSGKITGTVQADNLPATDVYACGQDKSGDIWFAHPNVLARIDANTHKVKLVKENKSRSDPDWLASVYSIYFDSSNNLWLGCQQGLAYAITQPAPFMQFTASAVSETRIGHAYYLYPSDDSTVYSCAQDGLYKVSLNSGTITAIAQKKPFYCYFIGPGGKPITANLDGSFVLQNRLVPLQEAYPAFAPAGKIIINSYCYVGDSMLVLGTENFRGIFLWNYKKNTVLNIHDSTPGHPLKEDIVNGLFHDSHGRVWVLGDHSISLFDPQNFTVRQLLYGGAANKKFYSIFFDVCEVKGDYYIASYGAGIVVLDSSLNFKRQITVADGLVANSVYKILPWRDSLLFVTSNNGISVLTLQHSAVVTNNYYETDGLHGNTFEENSGIVWHNKILAGGDGGITMIEPALLRNSPALAKVYIERINIATSSKNIDTANLLITNMDIPNDALQITPYFSSPAFSNQSRMSFTYRIKEISKDWIKLSDQNFINLIGLGPGRYTLEVMPGAVTNTQSKQTTSLVLHILPKWYQTLGFKILIFVIVSLLLYGTYRYRLMQLKKQDLIRKEIASDLHDDIGSTLNAVKVYTHLAQKNPGHKEYLGHIESSLTDVAQSLRDIIWVLDQSDDTVRQLFERIKKFATPMLVGQNISFKTSMSDDISNMAISKTEKRNLLLIAKETITNSIKYSACNKIELVMGNENGNVFLHIADNGKGFDIDSATSGNGIRNMRSRAEQINYSVTVKTAAGEGTQLLIRKNR
jgi:signal transduction histidine kinase/ligand-binding sensor domain-containing protein